MARAAGATIGFVKKIAVVHRRLLVTFGVDAVNRTRIESDLAHWDVRFDARVPTDENLQWAEVIFGNVEPSRLPRAPMLRWIHSPSAGIDQYDDVRHRLGAVVTHATGICDDAVAEHGIMLVMMALRRAPITTRAQLSRTWTQSEVFGDPPRLLRGSSTHVLGFGRIAQCLVGKLDRLGAVTTVYRRQASGPQAHPRVLAIEQLDEHVGEADILVSLLPGGRSTAGLVGHSVFEAMRRGSVFVNLGRGSTVDEQALETALACGRVRTAALDVFATEPLPPESSLWDTEHVIVTPHIAGRFVGDVDLQCQEFVDLVRSTVD